MGVPYLAVRGLLGSDLLSYRDDFLVRENPFNAGEQTVLAQSIRPDVAVFHALKADKFGNAITPGRRDDAMMARAASTVIVTTEEVIEDRLKETDAISSTFINGLDVAAVERSTTWTKYILQNTYKRLEAIRRLAATSKSTSTIWTATRNTSPRSILPQTRFIWHERRALY